MQKSMQKKMIVFNTEDSPCFEQVHLILKDSVDWQDPAHSMVAEATRIIQRAEMGKMRRKNALSKAGPKETRARFCWFLAGFLFALVVALPLIFRLSRLI